MKLLTVSQVAAELAVSPKLVYRLTKLNEIPHIRISSAIRFDPEAIELWVSNHTIGPPAEKKK
jgi:excisionase family DNA binding protein